MNDDKSIDIGIDDIVEPQKSPLYALGEAMELDGYTAKHAEEPGYERLTMVRKALGGEHHIIQLERRHDGKAKILVSHRESMPTLVANLYYLSLQGTGRIFANYGHDELADTLQMLTADAGRRSLRIELHQAPDAPYDETRPPTRCVTYNAKPTDLISRLRGNYTQMQM